MFSFVLSFLRRCLAKTPVLAFECIWGRLCLTIYRLAWSRKLVLRRGTWPSLLLSEWILSQSLICGYRVLSHLSRLLRRGTNRRSSLRLYWWSDSCVLRERLENSCLLPWKTEFFSLAMPKFWLGIEARPMSAIEWLCQPFCRFSVVWKWPRHSLPNEEMESFGLGFLRLWWKRCFWCIVASFAFALL